MIRNNHINFRHHIFNLIKLNLFSFFICCCQHHERKAICLYIFLISDRQWGTEHQYLFSRFLGISILQLLKNNLIDICPYKKCWDFFKLRIERLNGTYRLEFLLCTLTPEVQCFTFHRNHVVWWSQGHYGFHSFPVVDWFCLFI
jgi:hypothetical protein